MHDESEIQGPTPTLSCHSPKRPVYLPFAALAASIFAISSASSSSICLSILAPREGSLPCILAGSVGSISAARVSASFVLPEVSSFWDSAAASRLAMLR